MLISYGFNASITSMVSSKIWFVQSVIYGQHDAACRVIARLKKERDEARSLLAQADRQIPMPASVAVTTNTPTISNGKRGRYFHYVILGLFSFCINLNHG